MAPTFIQSALTVFSAVLLVNARIDTGIDYTGLVKRDPAVSNNIPSGFEHMGCYTDNVNSRALYQKTTTSGSMTEEYCINFCSSNGFPYAGVEYSQECYCGSYIAAGSSKASASDCNMPCSGDETELCGGSSRLNIFHNKSDVAGASGPVHNPGVNNWGYLGCYTDSVASRTMPNGGQVNGAMTVAGCTVACQNQGYSFAGVEYAGECYCSNSLPDSFAAPDGSSGCNMLCAGNSTEYCGGPNRLDAYGLGKKSILAPKWASQGCITDSVQSRTFRYAVGVPGGADNMTVPNCQSACNAAGYSLAGLEYAQECWCDNSYQNGGGPAPDGDAQCNMACKGDGQTVCGGPNRLNVYSYVGGDSTSTSATTTTTTTASSTTTSTLITTTTAAINSTTLVGSSTTTALITSTTAAVNSTTLIGSSTTTALNTTTTAALNQTATAASNGTSTTSNVVSTTTTTTSVSASSTVVAGNFTYRGCYIDGQNGRILGAGPSANDLTVESCISGCQSQGYTIAGMEYSTECYCGNSIVNGGKPATSESDCNMACGGNKTETCGGPGRMSLYSKGNFTSYGAPTAKNSSLPGNWTYKGCSSDTPQPRVLPYQIDMTQNLTISNCLNLCAEFGYMAASMEYGEQCFCGDDTDRINAGATWLTDGQCNTPCSGEPDALCGGANAMNYYTWEGLQTWGQATGDDAGQYEMFIGGVVVPLITTVGINGKILFTEKKGTSPAPYNSTGAFELDPSLASNFSAAWRALHGLKTDVFCSAGLTLPDKAGRIINIGGWGSPSTYGVRFYTPDGSPGQPSHNDWEENLDEVHLLDRRWYPTAVQMVNGSILVVGGEDGSNGPPMPTLEVIPTPAGVSSSLYMDWLERTDPNNLYPFLAVLPSGGIAVFYYNEARILDENTFQTVKTLPNIPGAVNNFLAGRTYPLEGTAMLMPQHYPYTDPLTVMICGGATPYAGVALDNCVSIQPEVQNQNWTIERMPDKRVITCMVALPDGTYVILNGAHQGTAGFGLASDPDHMAVLYDPSKPVNHRMTRLANTTIDRLYHSEAILMQDGRILVSGSDPEDQTHPQEYRVEVFIPPYLMGDRASSRPDFVFQQNITSFNYGAETVIMVNSSVSKISLMAAVSSTHGNSMGQRTIFPQFSCSQGTASVATTNSVASTNSTLTSRHLFGRQTNSTSTANSNSTNTASYTNTCTVTMPPNGHTCGGPGWHQLFVLDANGTPSVSKWVRIGGDPAGLGNWPNFPDFTLPGV